MGTNCAPYLANLFLHVYEYEYLSALINEGKLDLAKRLSMMSRYQDDCVVFNDDAAFEQHYKLIYPPEMELKNTNISPAKCTFLDLTISVYRGKFHYKSFDKRNSFGFEVVNFPNLKGNIPKIPSYGVYISQLVRFCEVNDAGRYFMNNVREMNIKFCNQGFDINSLRKKFEIFCKKYIHMWAKLNCDISSDEVVHMLFDIGI